MFVENYIVGINADLERIADLLEQNMPEEIKQSLIAEQIKLTDVRKVLTGEDSKGGEVFNLRARLRWARSRRDEAKDAATKRKAQDEVTQLEQAIASLASKGKKKKG